MTVNLRTSRPIDEPGRLLLFPQVEEYQRLIFAVRNPSKATVGSNPRRKPPCVNYKACERAKRWREAIMQDLLSSGMKNQSRRDLIPRSTRTSRCFSCQDIEAVILKPWYKSPSRRESVSEEQARQWSQMSHKQTGPSEFALFSRRAPQWLIRSPLFLCYAAALFPGFLL
ncbi:uncharacterized protein BT62DRAFT_1006221 [Guyanagaster necrorhizus]|uniref:Uncharacterized protein n=1 Tax=Guyanagaster necrorhizus TaxID=856835 RepID=A0A9P7VSY1_9AGAR|nr:uncharacterized protein BT62DRAFT_1006221 [Guyanagaster necrorhizus MCA 3950]KAG7446048.1 hypothetical protein BT62DRAFT_1006221 [Guyanagaster necrorhizus MCA 3950]